VLLAANPRKTEAENGVSGDILRGNFKNAAEIGAEKEPGPANPVYSFRNWLEYPVFKSHRPREFSRCLKSILY
jgi:hypothetical protein